MLIIENANDNAADLLFDIAFSTDKDNKKLLTTIARTLRLLDSNTIEVYICNNICSENEVIQLTTIYLVGWLSSTNVANKVRSLIDLPKQKYLLELAKSLERIEDNLLLSKLMRSFKEAQSHEYKWSLLKIIIDISDPLIIREQRDSLFFKALYEDELPIAFKYYAYQELNKKSTKKEILNGEKS